MTDTAPAYAQALDQLRRERDDLRAQLTIAEANSATSRAALEDGLAYQKQLQSERNAAIERADRAESSIRHADDQNRAVTSEMLAAVKHSDDLRAQLKAVTAERDAARAELDGTRSRLTMTTRDLDAAERTVAALKAVAHAIISAVAKEVP